MRESKSSPRRIAVAEKQAAALNLRRAGATFADIARQLGYTTEGAAHRCVMAALDKMLREPAIAARKLELDRCDRLMLGYWQKAAAGNQDALDRVLKIMAHRAKLQGLYAAKSVELVGPDGGPPVIGFLGMNMEDFEKLPASERVARLRAGLGG